MTDLSTIGLLLRIANELSYPELVRVHKIIQELDEEILNLMYEKWEPLGKEGRSAAMSEELNQHTSLLPRLSRGATPELPEDWVWQVPAKPWKVFAQSVRGRGEAWYGINDDAHPTFGGQVTNLVATAVWYRYRLERGVM